MASRIDEMHQSDPGQLTERMEELHRAILKLAGNRSPRLHAQDGAESTISSIELDAAGSMKSRAPSLSNPPGPPPPPRHPAHSYANSLRFPNPPQRSISDRIHNPSPISLSPTPLFEKRLTPEQRSLSPPPTELPGSEPSDASSSYHRLS
ncbi:MAG: hypothetical protein INR71_02675, partial [Terriglobus roseus]|nr:hypothetical protein [Terriglobus roseus]